MADPTPMPADGASAPSALWPDAPRLGDPDPFPPYAFKPGRSPHPTRDPLGHSYGRADRATRVPPESWREDKAYLRGIDLFHAGYFWEAHEAWEGIWLLSRDDTQRAFLQGLIQLAAGLLKRSMGQDEPAARLRERGLQTLEPVPSPYMGLDLEAVRTSERPRLELDFENG